MSRSRAWCFTYFLGYEDHYEALLERLECKYIVYGREVCPNTGKEHLQGYVEFENAKTLEAVKKFMGSVRLHVEKRKGTAKQASDYCKKGSQSKEEFESLGVDGPNFGKDASVYERGEISKDPATVNADRWKVARKLAEDGKFDEIDDELWVKYQNSFRKMRKIEAVTMDGDLQHLWIYGPTGTGKSREAETYTPFYRKDPKERWWDGYDGEDNVVIEDFDKYQKEMGGDIKRWADRYPFKAPIKGGYLDIRPKRIIITSNYHPREIWDDPMTYEPLERRFTFVHKTVPFSAVSENFNSPSNS